MKYLSTLYLALLVPSAYGQSFAIGSTTAVFYDVSRARDVACEVHYPAATAGVDVPVETGAFPVLVIGHGFVMTVDAYTYLWQHFVPQGFIVVLPTTEGSFAPAHAAFGEDLAFVANALIAANNEPASPYYQHVLPAAALMGHSMGGGAAFLGAAGNANIRALIGMAPAETTPSAIAAASLVQVPTLMFAATEDCVTPITDHAAPIYAALNMPCKAFVNITGGGHCYFGDDSFTCSFGELTCGPNLTISRDQQHAVVTDIADLWLKYHVLNDGTALSPLLDSLASTSRFVAETTCLSTRVDSAPSLAAAPQAQLRDGVLTVNGLERGDGLVVMDALGRIQWVGSTTQNTLVINLGRLAMSHYFIQLRSPDRYLARAVVIGN
jgi:predicted dienelactone hydrolase